MDDVLYFQDDAGNQIGLMMIDRFEFEGKSYALLATPEDTEDGGVYVMRMEEKDGELSFAMPDDDEMEKITPFIVELLEHAQGGCTHDCCSCGGCHGEDEDEDCCCDDDCCCQH